MIIDVPIRVWVAQKTAETGLSYAVLMRRLLAGEFNGERALANTRRIVKVVMSCNRAKAIKWTAAKMEYKMDSMRCGCGAYGYRPQGDRSRVCAICEEKELTYGRSLAKVAANAERRRRFETSLLASDNMVDESPMVCDDVAA